MNLNQKQKHGNVISVNVGYAKNTCKTCKGCKGCI